MSEYNIWSDAECSGLSYDELMTNFRRKALHNFDGNIYSTALQNGIGGNIVSFDSNKHSLLLTEAPLKKAIDLWLDNIFLYNISVFVTLTNDFTDFDVNEVNDLDLVKLKKYRDSQSIDLHHVKNIAKYTTKYHIFEESLLYHDDDCEVWSCKVSLLSEIRLLLHVKATGIADSVGLKHLSKKGLCTKFKSVNDKILEYATNLNVAFNCFMGVGRARFSAFTYLQTVAYKNNISLQNSINQLMNNTVSYPFEYNEECQAFIDFLGEK